jgi:hypothetical protein
MNIFPCQAMIRYSRYLAMIRYSRYLAMIRYSRYLAMIRCSPTLDDDLIFTYPW